MNGTLIFPELHEVIDIKTLVRLKFEKKKAEYDRFLLAHYAVLTDITQMVQTIMQENEEEQNEQERTKD